MSSIDEHCLSHSARAWYSSARLTLNLRLFRDAAALIGREGSSMIIKHYSDVKPGTYAGTPDGVQVREMITGLDGAPNFSLRVFDVQPGVSTPFHTHEHEHEVFILEGRGTVRTEGSQTPFKPGDSVFIAPKSFGITRRPSITFSGMRARWGTWTGRTNRTRSDGTRERG